MTRFAGGSVGETRHGERTEHVGMRRTYRGHLAAPATRREREFGGEMMSAWIVVNMVEADASPEERDEMTEWVNVLVFSPKLMKRLEGQPKGAQITVIGSVAKKFWQMRTGNHVIVGDVACG